MSYPSEHEKEECILARRLLSSQFKELKPVFVAMGDETRQQIFITLLENEDRGMRVPQITEQTHLSRPAVSHHLQILLRAGLVQVQKRGTMNWYSVADDMALWAAFKGLTDNIYTVVCRANRQEGKQR